MNVEQRSIGDCQNEREVSRRNTPFIATLFNDEIHKQAFNLVLRGRQHDIQDVPGGMCQTSGGFSLC